MSDELGYEGQQDDYSDMDSPGAGEVVRNQPHDEEVEISDDDGSDDGMIDPRDQMGPSEDEEDVEGDAMRGAPTAGVESPPRDHDSGEEDDYDMAPGMGVARDDDEPAAQEQDVRQQMEGEYNPADFAQLKVSEDIKELFQYIGRYKPRPHQLETKIKCFIPDYIPAVGDIDEFIKVPRPDGKPDFLGLRVLDEPATIQSDPTVLNLQLRQVSKQSGMKPMEVSSVEEAAKNPKRIDTWIKSIQELHADKPPPTVSYSKNMPEIETLMQEWPVEMEELLGQVKLPSGNMDIDLLTLTKVVCNLMDIPVYKGKAIESLHVLFTLYLEFKNNPFLKAQKEAAMGGGYGADILGGSTAAESFLSGGMSTMTRDA